MRKPFIVFSLFIYVSFTGLGFKDQTDEGSRNCISYQYSIDEDWCREGSIDISITNSCNAEQYVVAIVTKYDGNKRVVTQGFLRPGKKKSNWACGKYNTSTIRVRYWQVDPSDYYSAMRSGKAWIKEQGA